MRISLPYSRRSGKGRGVSTILLAWYDKHRRDLPWRAPKGTKPDPYRVWLSEVMLQQTTVVTVAPYFLKFVKRWPDVRSLARAKREDVLKMWAGLGYYRRAHALHETAKKICADFGGHFPETEDELKTLPGCGSYTAAAIAAIAFGQRANVVDGNVERVMARLFAVKTPLPKAKLALKGLAAKLVPKTRSGDYAQALMDLGATVCTPRGPKCDLCPLSKNCEAYAEGNTGNLPFREKRTKKPVRRAMAFYVRDDKGAVLLRRRPAKGLLGGMMEIPTSAWKQGPMPSLVEAPFKASWRVLPGKVRHVFSHFDLELSVAVVPISGRDKGTGGRWVPEAQLKHEALPSVMRKIIRHVQEHEKGGHK